MPILNNVQHDFFSEETDTESPVSTQLMQKIGENLNFLNGLVGNIVEINSTSTWQVPEGVTRILVLGAGGGGGGGGGNSSGTSAGGGGAGCVPQLVALKTTPLDTYNVTIGAGGAGGGLNANGSAGGNTTFISTSTLTGPTFFGANGGLGGPNTLTYNGGQGLNRTIPLLAEPTSANIFSKWQDEDFFTYGGGGNTLNASTGQAGQASPYANGGIGGTGSDCGGGGGAGFGAGGNGSSTTSGTATSAAANSSAGGGGGGGAKSGGNGGSGKVLIIF